MHCWSHIGITANVSLQLLMNGDPLQNNCSRNIDNEIHSGVEVTLSCVPMPIQCDIVT